MIHSFHLGPLTSDFSGPPFSERLCVSILAVRKSDFGAPDRCRLWHVLSLLSHYPSKANHPKWKPVSTPISVGQVSSFGWELDISQTEIGVLTYLTPNPFFCVTVRYPPPKANHPNGYSKAVNSPVSVGDRNYRNQNWSAHGFEISFLLFSSATVSEWERESEWEWERECVCMCVLM